MIFLDHLQACLVPLFLPLLLPAIADVGFYTQSFPMEKEINSCSELSRSDNVTSYWCVKSVYLGMKVFDFKF